MLVLSGGCRLCGMVVWAAVAVPRPRNRQPKVPALKPLLLLLRVPHADAGKGPLSSTNRLSSSQGCLYSDLPPPP
jgi:hypothetical protein